MEAEGIPLEYVLDDPDENGPLVLTTGVGLLTDDEGAVIVTALADDGHDMTFRTAIEDENHRRARQMLEVLGYPMTRYTMSDNTLRVLSRPDLG